ncbi:MAG TPA: amylo-alpha-1,6-glucosidase [Polyangia bacterium]|nr:amylo-alpha-1,6-glucosidase [Polyangia bacterium]
MSETQRHKTNGAGSRTTSTDGAPRAPAVDAVTTSPDRSDDDELLQHQDTFYIQATSSRTDDRTRVLKNGDTFGVFDRFGDVQPVGLGEQGLYHDGTRFLSRLELRVAGRRPLLLSSTVRKENDLLAVDLSNPDLKGPDGALVLARGELHVFRSKFIWRNACYERLRISSFGRDPLQVALTFDYDADFADIFEVRGSKRPRRGQRTDEAPGAQSVSVAYDGLDGVRRRTRIAFDPAPTELTARRATYRLLLEPRQVATVVVTVDCERGQDAPAVSTLDQASESLAGELSRACFSGPRIQATSDDLDEWIARSISDLQMMITDTAQGAYPYAGVPWFSTPFGRDGIITAMEALWFEPALARGVLGYLAATQADETVPERDAQPGKILHEARGGEMAALGEVPFGRYYGSVDATPLYVMLAAAYLRRTGDTAFIRGLAPHVDRALAWIERDGDIDGDGFVEYARQTPKGLVQQGWKDSHDSVFHADGTLAEGPIALCEVQGYVYAAFHAAAEIATALGRPGHAETYLRKAQVLRARFAEKFWDRELGTYVLALDGQKRPCRVRSSNAGHALWTGIADPVHARQVAETLMRDEAFSGWGIRTISNSEPRYNPMSYHNGSVWPHDNALVAAGFSRYGFAELGLRVFTAMLAASATVDLHRLPELFCGFTRRPGEGPTLYPVACAPQAWASAAVFLLLGTALGISIDGARGEIAFNHPVLPPGLGDLRINGLQVGGGRIDLLIETQPHDVGLTVLARDPGVSVVIVK